MAGPTFGVAGGDEVGPVALERLLVEGEALRTAGDVALPVDAVHVEAAVVGVAHPEQAELARTLRRRLRRL